MSIGIFGINYCAASLEARECIIAAFRGLEKQQKKFFQASVFLVTCNRAEVYFLCERDCSQDLLGFFEQEGVPTIFLETKEFLSKAEDSVSSSRNSFESGGGYYVFFGQECFAHLFSVVSGLDSVIVGETEIQGQVKKAYCQAAETDSLPFPLHFLFQKALKEGKKARSEFSLAHNKISMEGELVALLKEKEKDKSVNILFVGFSTINQKVASFFYRQGYRKLSFCSDSVTATPWGAVISRASLDFFKKNYEVVIFGAKEALPEEKSKELFAQPKRLVVDLSVPRTIAKEGEFVIDRLIDMEQLNKRIYLKSRQESEMLYQDAKKFLKFSAKKHWHTLLERCSYSSTGSIFSSSSKEVLSC